MIDLGPNSPRVFAEPLGRDFPKSVVEGLIARSKNCAPHDMAKVTLIVNTARMARRIKSVFLESNAGFLPRILLLDRVETLLPDEMVIPSRETLRRRLELAQLIKPVIENHPELAAQSSLFAVVDSLASLMDEMQGEGVTVDKIADLDVTDQSGHWQNAKTLIGIAHQYVENLDEGLDKEARQRAIVLQLIESWHNKPIEHPLLLVGSTGSRGTTSMLMQAIAKLPQGAIVLPGFDTDLPMSVWNRLDNPLTSEDHPQYRFRKILSELELDPSTIEPWFTNKQPLSERNAVISLAMRPAPVTDSWLTEGPNLPDLPDAMSAITLLEAPTQRSEALTIAMRLRQAAETGQTAALITPDRMLTRQVTAALSRWDIIPDDSAGMPLHLSTPGRFLRHTAELFFRPLDAELLLTLLKHPLTQSGEMAGVHGLYTQRLELALRREGLAYPTADDLIHLVQKAGNKTADPTEMQPWATWLQSAFTNKKANQPKPLSQWLADHKAISEFMAHGDGSGSGGLWDKAAGRAAADVFATLEENAEFGGDMHARDYLQLLHGLLSQGEVRDRDEPHPKIMIWGTLEARVQGAELVILGGLNESVWPEAVSADTWLNRSLRHQAGLLLPDRQIGLSAHDFQQAVAAPEVWLTRAIRSDESETVPSRWINRLTNLIDGLPEKNGPKALVQMRERGNLWLTRAEHLENVTPVPPEGRAAPCPPVAARPRDFSVTEIKTLIRDPYAIYAKHCLKLRKLDPLVPEANAPMRGIVIHEIMEVFVKDIARDQSLLTVAHLMKISDDVLLRTVPWPATRIMWRARLARVSDWIVAGEQSRLSRGKPFAMESDAQGKLPLAEFGGSIRARADRLDMTDDGMVLLYDYKSGDPPSAPQQKQFDKQLLIEAAMIEEGAFTKLGPQPVKDAVYVGLGAKPKEVAAPLDKETPAETLAGLKELIASYLEPNQYYSARRMLQSETFSGDYDQLARHGEWDDSDPPCPKDLT